MSMWKIGWKAPVPLDGRSRKYSSSSRRPRKSGTAIGLRLPISTSLRSGVDVVVEEPADGGVEVGALGQLHRRPLRAAAGAMLSAK